jgi:putative transposase
LQQFSTLVFTLITPKIYQKNRPTEKKSVKTQSTEDTLRDLMGGTIQEMLEAELDEHLGYRSYERSDSSNYRNGKKTKKIRGNLGETEIEVPQDRDGTFDPKVVKSVKRTSPALSRR